MGMVEVKKLNSKEQRTRKGLSLTSARVRRFFQDRKNVQHLSKAVLSLRKNDTEKVSVTLNYTKSEK